MFPIYENLFQSTWIKGISLHIKIIFVKSFYNKQRKEKFDDSIYWNGNSKWIKYKQPEYHYWIGKLDDRWKYNLKVRRKIKEYGVSIFSFIYITAVELHDLPKHV